MNASPSHTVGLELLNRTNYRKENSVTIPHGGLRTTQTQQENLKGGEVMSPSHTVGLEPQTTTLNKIRHINHFVKGTPFSNEVNFPKSEIMQS